METRVRARALVGVAALASGVALAAGACGHSVDPRAPYDNTSGVPTPQALLAALDPPGDIRLTWHPTPEERSVVDGWLVDRRTADESAFTRLTSAQVRDTFFVDPTAQDNVRYVYRVRGVTAASIESEPAETIPLRADRLAPSTPTGVAVAPRPAALELTFTPGPETDLLLFEVRVFETGSMNPPQTRTVFASPALLAGLVPGAQYAVTVAAIDSAGRTSAPNDPPVFGTPDPNR